ncbi:hypothetical protein [Intrasporangium sp.]|uniref:hypothetical protein n=1 Tax=Intrasporangium sp. TaxID=1925024 RepID=UPI00293B3533|nr:hypothetical protein [Intrasporangium sp.]MDV3223487.1 hypothetical protein [Intrasporangium sp.]
MTRDPAQRHTTGRGTPPQRSGSRTPELPPRVTITSPRTRAARARRVSIASEIDAQSRLGEVYVDSLMRSQLRLALAVVAALAFTLGLVPLVLHLVPAWGRIVVLGIPVPWVVLTLVAFVEIVTLGVVYVRRAERNEDAFSDLLDHR